MRVAGEKDDRPRCRARHRGELLEHVAAGRAGVDEDDVGPVLVDACHQLERRLERARDRDALHGGAGKMAGLEILLVDPQPDAGATGDVRGAFSFEVREQNQAMNYG